MIKKTIGLILVLVLIQTALTNVFAVRAYPLPVKVTQPDGSELTIRLQGDEFNHFQTTEDGYVVKKNAKGYYTYASVNTAGEIIEGNIIAKNIIKRSAADVAFLSTLDKTAVFKTVERNRQKSKRLASALNPQKAYPMNGSPKALVILANFKDKAFSVTSPQISFQNLCTQSGYSANGGTGSAKDYFMSSSYGKFAPDFVVVDTVTLPQNLSYYGINDSNGDDKDPAQMIVDACAAADAAGLDFTQFDTDGDGTVDNVFVYYAGYNEAEGGSENTIWPHRWSISGAKITTGITFDGKKINDYSCTSELKGTAGTNMCGIGTFCHEFGHVLGLPDFYHTKDATGSKTTLDAWDVMDYGPYLNGGCTPPAYSAYERFFLGFLTPGQINTASNVTLKPMYLGTTQPENTAGQAYLLSATTHNMSATSPGPAEFFIVEYRKHTGWDRYLGQAIGSIDTNNGIPADGLCVWHIDYLPSEWDANTPNNYTGTTQTASSHMRVYLQPLSGQTTTPGTTFTTGSFTPTTWSGTNINRAITSISVTADSLTFKLMGGASIFGPYTALPGSNISATGFTANWTAATGATKYLLNVYKKTTTSGSAVTETTGFDNFPTTVPTGWTSSVTTTYTTSGNYGNASPSVKLAATGATMTSPAYSGAISSVSFWLKGQGTDSNSSLLIEGSKDGSAWTTIQSINNLPTTGTTKTISVDNTLGYKVLKFTYTKSAGNLAIDDIAITYGGSITTITKVLTDQEVTSGTSYDVTGLTPGETYYYTVKASNGTEVSEESNEVSVVSLVTSVANPEINNVIIKAVSGGVSVQSAIGEKVRIYDVTGSLIKDITTTEPVSTISLPVNRIYIVRTSATNAKVIVK